MSKVKVLVVEDNTDVAEGIRDILEDKGYSITDVVDSGEEAIKKAGQTRPDLVLMDIILKGDIDGIKAAKQIHSRFNIPVIYLTGYADEEKLQQAKLTEPYGYILKPFNAQELHATIEMAIYKRKLENELKSRFSTVLRSIGDAVITIDKKGFITFMNPIAEALTGWKNEVSQGKALTEIFDVKDKDKIISIKSSSMEALFRGDIDSLTNESILISDGRKEIPIEFNIAAIRDYKRIISGFVLVFRNITERKRAEVQRAAAIEALRESEGKYRSILENTEEGYYEVDIAGNLTFFNDSLCKMLGYPKDELMGMNNRDYIDEKRYKKIYKIFNEVYISGDPIKAVQMQIVRKNGIKKYGEISVSLIKDSKNQPIGFRGVVRDISDRKQTEEVLRKSEEKYRKLFEEAMDAIFVADATTGILIDFNRTALELVGRKKSELVGKHQRILHPPEETEGEFSRTFKKHLKEREGKILETQVITKKGEIKDVSIKASIFELEGRRVLLGIFRDITEHKKTEKDLRQSEQNFKALAENAFDCIIINDKNANYLYANTKTAELTGYSIDELLRLNVKDLTPPERIEEIIKRIKRRVEGDSVPSNYESKLLKKDGSIISIEVAAAKTEWRGKPADMVFFHDITERKQLEAQRVAALEALYESEEKYRTLTENINIGIYRNTGKEGKFLEANPAIIKIFGCKSKEEFLSVNAADFYQDLDGRNRFIEKILKDGFVKNEELRLKRKDGTPFVASLSTVGVKDEKGKIISYDGILEDITERKQMEKVLQESEEKYRLIVETSKDAIVINQKDKFIFFNKAFADLLGYSKEELMFKDYSDVYTEKGIEILMARKEHRKRGEDVPSLYETLFRKKDGSEINVEANVTIIDYKGEKATFAVIRDITEQKKLLATLKESLEKTKGLEGLIHICSSCKKIRDEDKEEKPWVFPEKYIMERLPNVGFTHSICPECVKKLYPEYYEKIFSNKSKNDEIDEDL